MQVLLLITTVFRCSAVSLFGYLLFIVILALLCAQVRCLFISSAVQSLSGTSVYCRFNWYPLQLSNTECRQCVCPEGPSLLLRFTIAIFIYNGRKMIYRPCFYCCYEDGLILVHDTAPFRYSRFQVRRSICAGCIFTYIGT